MTQQTINYGATANDGTGDPLRTFASKSHANFSELYALTSQTINAGAVAFTGTTVQKIQAAINAAVAAGATRVFVPDVMTPYDASLITFNSTVQMIREGGNFSEYDVQAYGAASNGIQDDTLSINSADTAARGANVNFPPGTYKTTSTITCTSHWNGCASASFASTIIKPSAAVTGICIDLKSGGVIDGLYVDGVNTSGATGIDVGTAFLVNVTTVRDTEVWRFGGVGGRGIKVAQLVTGVFENVYACQNYINLHTNGGNTPTDSLFLNCQFREATTKGVWIESGYSVRFIKPLFESNFEEGLYINNTGLNAVEIGIYDPWYENNWRSAAVGAARHAQYHFSVSGTGTLRFVQQNAKFSEDLTQARAMHITNSTGFVDFNCKVANEAGQILVDGTGYGNFESWNAQNGAFATTVTDSTGVYNSAWNSDSYVTNLTAAWTTWTPTVTGNGGMTISGLVVTRARYKAVGKTLYVALYLTFTTATAGAPAVNITLPTNVRTLISQYNRMLIDDGAYHDGYVATDTASPTSNLSVNHVDGTNWTLGANRAVYGSFVLELF